MKSSFPELNYGLNKNLYENGLKALDSFFSFAVVFLLGFFGPLITHTIPMFFAYIWVPLAFAFVAGCFLACVEGLESLKQWANSGTPLVDGVVCVLITFLMIGLLIIPAEFGVFFYSYVASGALDKHTYMQVFLDWWASHNLDAFFDCAQSRARDTHIFHFGNVTNVPYWKLVVNLVAMI